MIMTVNIFQLNDIHCDPTHYAINFNIFSILFIYLQGRRKKLQGREEKQFIIGTNNIYGTHIFCKTVIVKTMQEVSANDLQRSSILILNKLWTLVWTMQKEIYCISTFVVCRILFYFDGFVCLTVSQLILNFVLSVFASCASG